MAFFHILLCRLFAVCRRQWAGDCRLPTANQKPSKMTGIISIEGYKSEVCTLEILFIFSIFWFYFIRALKRCWKITQTWYMLWFFSKLFVQSSIYSLRSANGQVQDSLNSVEIRTIQIFNTMDLHSANLNTIEIRTMQIFNTM